MIDSKNLFRQLRYICAVSTKIIASRYIDHKITIKISDFSVLEGYLPPRALGLVMEWAALHQGELARNWELAQANQSLAPIDTKLPSNK
jgi:hypothetical protein